MKPEVFYTEVMVPPVAGRRAVVVVQDGQHHTLSKELLDMYDNVVTTSTIVEVVGNCFETQNTLYRQAVPVVA